VEAKKFTTAQRKALEALLDDSSPTVRAALLAQLARHGQESVDFLRTLARQPNRILALHAARYLRELNFSDPVSEFRTFIRSLNYELETGALLLSRTVNAELDVGACCSQLDAMAARCRELIAAPATAREKCRVLNRVLFHEFSLRGNADNYTDPLNSYLDQVLVRRKGIPISLSIVYLLVAERVGVQLEAVAMPGHFMVGCYEESVPFFIDPFNAGVFLTAGEVFILLRQSSGHASISDLAPTPVREVLCRCCRNLANHYTAAHEPDHARLFAGFVAEFESTYERHAQS
jgi:regulator of sirC expression with transglutaminase-like and TPR domain